MKFVIDKTTKLVLRYGYCDFENDGSFLPDIESIIDNDTILEPPIDEQNWYWNEQTQQFQSTAP